MTDFFIVWFALCGLALVVTGAALVRNRLVLKERLRILHGISQAAVADIEAGRLDWERRYQAFDAGPSYGRMVMEMWKPVHSYRSEFHE
jgi:hypothetical protein